ncbi:MAG: DUF370 domain-containing protein [Ruminococcus sp.]|jgi:sugar-specific transcriptional regulator TrmB|nr:DUF370 domain-containing protein [Ruminococcus sp.]
MPEARYLHIGGGFSVDMEQVAGIFDMDNTTVRSCTKTLLDKAEKEKRCIYTTYELPKSFIVTVKNGVSTIYISQLSAGTLRKRIEAGGL